MSLKYKLVSICFLAFIILTGCSSEKDTRFELLSANKTGIDFVNRVHDTVEFNILNYLYFYDGGGVAVGDLTNNGLPDIYFTANDEPDRLYLNNGNFEFEDITEQAGIYTDDEGWSTGVTMADVNGNGFLDIYVSRVNFLNKKGHNQLFINNGVTISEGGKQIPTFTERASEFGLDFEGYSTQAVFFDYDNDGDLDLFLLNHTMHSEKSYGNAKILREMTHPKAGDRLFRNDGGSFVDVTENAGIYSSHLGYGLGIAVGDITQNGWPDIYVGNDFHEDDYFYINNGDGTFTEMLAAMIEHTSRSSMGNDIGDINNNGRPDIISLDMLPWDDFILKRSGGADLKLVSDTKLDFGFKPQFARNTLQLNRGTNDDGIPLFSEISFVSGVAATDWSWAALFMDMDNNGYNDIFVTNGIYRRPNDLDYIRMIRDEQVQASLETITEEDLSLIDAMPEVKIPNVAFKNNGDLTFTDKAEEWGLNQPGFSHGAAYADLNNDGTLDLIVNNVNQQAFIYRNKTEVDEDHHYLKIRLKGEGMNTTGIGAKVIMYVGEKRIYREQMPTRGFQSSVEHVLHAGLGPVRQLDSLLVIWPGGRFQVMDNVQANQELVLNQADAAGEFDYNLLHSNGQTDRWLNNLTEASNIDFNHDKNRFDDFRREPLIPYKKSTNGPALAVADLTGNGLDDFYIGGAKWQPGVIYLQQNDGSFLSVEQEVFTEDREAEDVAAVFFDASGNGLPDLYVVSGGNEKTGNDPALRDRLYLNEGNGRFSKSSGAIPEFYVNGGTVAAADFDGDGSVDLFVGGKSVPWNYGLSPESYLLKNNGDGTFTDVTESIAPELRRVGMLNDAVWHDLNGSGTPELILAGEWMPFTVFSLLDGQLVDASGEFGFSRTGGLWQKVHITDVNGNGHPDIIAGNFGLNSRFTATTDSPLRLYLNDFEGTGQSVPVIANYRDRSWYTLETMDELVLQLRSLGRKFQSYEEFSVTPISRMLDQELLNQSVQKEIHMLESVLFKNDGNGRFSINKLPFLAQISPVKGIESGDITGDGYNDLLLTGNLFDVKPSMGGRQDAGRGLMLKGNGNSNFEPVEFNESGFLVNGESRRSKILNSINGNRYVIVARYDDTPLLFHINMEQ
ncbi:MAG: VCBS repeat-containing protein [Balneolaceae bacterium]